MKKIYILLFVSIILVSCNDDIKVDDKIIDNVKKCENQYDLTNEFNQQLNLKGVIINDDVKTVSSPMLGIITNYNCNIGQKVFSDTLIAQIKPDFNNPNTVNLSIQKSSLINQKTNLESIKNSTILTFDNQISDLKEQINITEKNIELTKKSSSLSKNDLEKQITTLEDSLSSLEESLKLSQKAKKEALEKIDISKINLNTNIKSLGSDNLLKIDEIFGITKENKRLNDKYEDYLGVKNTNLKRKVKSDFLELSKVFDSINTLSDVEKSKFLGDLVELDNIAKDTIKDSVANIKFPQSQIDGYYLIFLNYSNSLAELKNGWDNLENSKSSVITTFDTQILGLQNQIDTSKTSLNNLKTNKIGSVDVGLDLQLSNFDSGLKTLKSNLENLLLSKESQILNLDNQILQVNQSISSLNSNLTTRNIYAGINGIIKQKMGANGNNIGINGPLCQILPNTRSVKVKIYSPFQLNKGDKLSFSLNNKQYNIFVDNVGISIDPITKNYIYESNFLEGGEFKDGEILQLKIESNIDKKIIDTKNNKNIIIPISYVHNKINGNYVQIKDSDIVLEKEIELGDINGDYVNIKKGLDGVKIICK